MKASEIRSRFLHWFEAQGHAIVPSAPLIPRDDPTLYFVNAGMVQFKDVFTGADKRPYSRATTVQKCLRVSGKHNDLEVVGRTARHHTFFEMLGNFSFGDYFKAEAIPFAWELLTGEFGLDPNRLWVTIYEEDDEAYDLWRSKVGFPAERIQRLGVKDNFWSMGETGPCGPCTEIHWDHGPKISSDTRGPAGEDPRYVEIWNLVFMQFDQSASGRVALPRPSIDTGMGLERLAAVKQGVFNNYDTDLFSGLIQTAARQANVRYGADGETDVALRVLADHARATAFLVADGVMPSNVERGYVLRRIMRRAIRFGVKIGLDEPFFHHMTAKVVEDFGEAYPELRERQSFVHEVVAAEEERFRRTLDRGIRMLETHLEQVGRGGSLPGDVAFTLSDTFGFPLDLTRLIAAERGVGVQDEEFEAALQAQKARGRAAWKGSGEQAVGELWQRMAETHGTTTFTGYDTETGSGTVLALVASQAGAGGAQELVEVERLDAGQRGIVLLDRTPFYGESGGQVGDSGSLRGSNGLAEVTDTSKATGLHLHHVTLSEGSLAVGDLLSADVDSRRRSHTRRNHTATHLLHAALRQVLGEHVTQKGSLVAPDRLRFDFAHHKPVSPDELLRIEQIVNDRVLHNVALETRVESFEAAQASGAMALFGEKYDHEVRVVDVPGFSLELCGGTHVQRTGDIGLFRITSETGVAAGVRRLEAQTGVGALRVVREQDSMVADAARLLKTSPGALVESIRKLQDERKAAERKAELLQAQIASAAAEKLRELAVDVGGVKVLIARIEGDLKAQADRLREQLGSAVIVLATQDGGNAVLVGAATKDLAPERVHIGKLIQTLAPLIGGRGGGKPDLAQAGGSDPAGIDAALAQARELVHAALA